MADEKYVHGRLYTVKLNDLLPDPEQPRKYMDPTALAEMVESIKEHGIIQPPTFRLGDGGLLYIVTGERRCAAARMAGLTEVSAIYVDSGDYEELSLVENITRADLTAVEEAEAMDRLMKKHNFTQDDLAKKFSKTKSIISKTLSLNRLPSSIRDECRKDPVIPKRVLIEIAAKKQERSMVKEYQKYKDKLNPPKKLQVSVVKLAVRSAIDTMDVTGRKIEKLDIAALSYEDRESFVLSMENLKQTIESKLAAMVQ
jgi:ParB family transcriptional regulator, chromosome partitioning protein